ncbi:hypothetical protein TRFO_29971 [Tritrichomonas foetus]|uniref:Uncharacterized protein n=1 Tax=Tritrichomonas foetus TaxID=1144522 RepID=A0A1J4JUU9_9EUKA|nr:hypothetical protein TRFO_29971 [Tritrichomonas foetus]|eukprot:OHT02779.1 hypothetical protein TRFO_29971 [Tritrichomonas foetus]
MNFLTKFTNARPESVFSYAFSNDFLLLLTQTEALKDANLISFCEDVLKSLPKSAENLNDRWLLQTLISFSKKPENDVGSEMAMIDFESLNNKITQNIIPYLNNNEVTDKIAHNVCLHLLIFRDTYPGIFYSIFSSFEHILNVIGPARANKVIGPELLSFYENPDDSFFKMKIEDPMILLFFQYPCIFTNIEFCKKLQYKFTSENFYPKFISIFDKEMSLVDTTIEHQHHFIDTISNSFSNYIETTNDLSKPPEFLNQNQELIPLFILVNQHKIYLNLNKYLPLLNQAFRPSLASEIIQRMKNDMELFNMIKSMNTFSNKEITENDIVQYSLIFHLVSYQSRESAQATLSNPQLLEYSKYQFYLQNDQDSQTDFDFIRCYQVLHLFLTICKAPTKQLDNQIQRIKELLDSIANIAIQSLIIYDLFSLIFIQIDGKFVCHQFVVQKLVNVLVTYKISPYIEGAEAILKWKKPKKNNAANLLLYFERDINLIYKAVEEQNWQQANQLTEFNPYYRKLYKRAYLITFISNNQPVPPELEKERRNALFDYSLSSFRQDILNHATPYFKKYTDFINNRMKYKIQNDLLSCLPNLSQYQEVVAKLNEISDNIIGAIENYDIENSLNSFKVSDKLFNFLNNLNIFYQNASAGTGAHKNENFFDFDLCKALSRPFNNKEYESTQRLAEICKINLFPFIINNLSYFNIHPQYLSTVIDEYLIETICLALSNKLYSFLNNQQKVSPFIKKYIEQQSTKIDSPKCSNGEFSPTNKVIELIQSKLFMDIDDYIYNADHSVIYDYIIRSNNPTQYSNELIKILSIVEYVAPVNDYETLNKIHTFNSIRNITIATNPQKIITEIMKKGMFDKAINFIRTGISKESWGPPVCHLFSLCTSNEEQMDFILREFPDRFDLIESRFFHVPGVLPHLLKVCPPVKRDEIYALSLLPEEITLDSNIFDVTTVAQAFARHSDSIFKISKDMSAIFTDELLVMIMDRIKVNENYFKICAYLYTFFRDKSQVIDIWTTKVYTLIEDMSVNSVKEEEQYINVFKNQRPILQVIPDSDQRKQKIDCILEFLNLRPYLRYHLVYSFDHFDSPVFAQQFIGYIEAIDRFDLALKASTIFGCDILLYQIKRINVLVLTNNFNEVKQELNEHVIEIDRLDHEPNMNYDKTYFKLASLSKMPIFDPPVFDSIRSSFPIEFDKLLPLFVYHRIKATNEHIHDKEKHKFLSFFIRKAFSLKPCISLLVSFKFLDVAYQMFMRIENAEEQKQAFIYYFYKAALGSDIITKTENFLISQDPTFNITQPLWDSLVDFFHKNKMYNSLYKVYMIRNQLEEAAEAKMKLIDETKFLPHIISFLGHAIYCLTDAIHLRMNPKIKKMPPYIPLKGRHFEDVEKLKALLEFMLKLCELCNDRNIEFKPEYNILKDTSETAALAAMLFMNGENALLEELAKICPVRMAEVVEEASKVLAKEKIPTIMQSIQIIMSTDAQMAIHFLDQLLDQMAFGPNHGAIISIIMTFYREPILQCTKMIEYDFLAEASLLIIGHRLFDLLPLVAHRASLLGLTDLVQNCKKFM